jgi:hypothetical protein
MMVPKAKDDQKGLNPSVVGDGCRRIFASLKFTRFAGEVIMDPIPWAYRDDDSNLSISEVFSAKKPAANHCAYCRKMI